MFTLELTNEMHVSHGEQVLMGNIHINSFSESFLSPISYWSRNDYLSQWCSGLDEIVSGNKKSAIITSMYNPVDANFIIVWPLYLIGNDVFIQNSILFMDNLIGTFDETKLSNYIDDREIIDEDGEAVSEWQVSVSDIQIVLASIEKDLNS